MDLLTVTTPHAVTELSDAELADHITTWSGRIAAGEARLSELIAEFDAREAWAGPGLLSCAHWLVWRTGLSPGAAREKVRVARRLRELPLVASAFGAGRLSFSQVRAICRIATPDDQQRWIDLARHSTAAQLEKIARGLDRVRRTELDQAEPEGAAWRMRATTSYDAAGNRRIVLLVPAEHGPVVDAALEQLQAELDHEAQQATTTSGPPTDGDRDADPVPGRSAGGGGSAKTPRLRATLGDALLEMCRRTVDGAGPHRARRIRSTLTAQVDPVSGWARLSDGELLPSTSLSGVAGLVQVMRGLPGRGGRPRLRPVQVADLQRLDLGRSSRLPSAALRQLLGTVDGERCRFPGCTRHRRLHAHHVTTWADGGPTDLANLLLLCGRHHTLVHQLGFRLDLAADRTLTVHDPAGVPVPHHPVLPWGEPHALDPAGHVSAETLVPDRIEPRMGLAYCVSVLAQQAA